MTDTLTLDAEPQHVREARALVTALDGVDVDGLRDIVAQRRELGERLTALESRDTAAGPLSEYRSLGEYATAVALGTEKRAWVDQITANNAGVVPASWLKDVKGIVDRGRPAVEGTGGARQLPASGMSLSFPYFDGTLASLVGVQAAEKTEITSARVDIKAGSQAIATYAGGSDLSLQLIQRSDPSYVDAYLRILIAAYGVVTDAAWGAKLVAAATSTSVLPAAPTMAQVRTFITDADAKVQAATGAPASTWLVSGDVYTALVGVSAAAQDYFLPGPGLLPTFDPNLAAGTCIVTNTLAAGWHEQGPLTISDDVVAKLGRDYAVYGYAAGAVYLPKGVVKSTLVASAK